MLRTTIAIVAVFAGTAVAQAEPLKLEPNEMDRVTAGATNPANVIGTDNPAFENDVRGSLRNVNNGDLRFGYGGAVALPGNGADNANGNSAFDGRLLKPAGRN